MPVDRRSLIGFTLAIALASSTLAQVMDREAVHLCRIECTSETGTSVIERGAKEQLEREEGGSWILGVNELGYTVRATWDAGPPDGLVLHYRRLP